MEAKLVLFRKSGERREFQLSRPELLIGRAEDCYLRIPVASVSRHHCRITVSDDVIVIKDLDSANGTYVNKGRVDQVELCAGDRIVIGPTLFTLVVDGEPATLKAPERPAVEFGQPDEPDDVLEAAAGEAAGEDLATALEGSKEQAEAYDPIAALEALAESEEEAEGEETK